MAAKKLELRLAEKEAGVEPLIHFFEPVACTEIIPQAFHQASIETDLRRAGRYTLVLFLCPDVIKLDYAGLFVSFCDC